MTTLPSQRCLNASVLLGFDRAGHGENDSVPDGPAQRFLLFLNERESPDANRRVERGCPHGRQDQVGLGDGPTPAETPRPQGPR